VSVITAHHQGSVGRFGSWSGLDFAPGSDDDEAAGSALHELAELERRLYKAGITKIDIDGRT
jgi:hypothetical protein